MQPGEERREIEFVLAWHEDDPVLGRWDIDYDFAAAATSADPGARPTTAAPPSRSAPAARREPSAAAERPSRQPGETFRDTLRSGGSGPEMVVIPAGSFSYGLRVGCGLQRW